MSDYLEPEILRIAAAAQRVAYGEGRQSVTYFMNELGQPGWQTVGSGTDFRGFYIAGNAAVFAAVRDGVLVISIRGSADGNDYVEGDDGFLSDIAGDWASAAAFPRQYYDNIRIFIQAVLDQYALPTTKVVITGHSLGGQAATMMAALDLSSRFGDGANPLSNLSVVVFGSPGVPDDYSDMVTGSIASRMWSMSNSDDGVVYGLFDKEEPSGHRPAIFVQDQGGGFDGPNALVGAASEHIQKLYYQAWTDVSFFSFYGAWYSHYNSSSDYIIALSSSARPVNGSLNDAFSVLYEDAFVLGLAGDDSITVADNLTGRVFISGGGGDDILTGGVTVDYLDGGAGLDTLSGGGGGDYMAGGSEGDSLSGGSGDDYLYGNDGVDYLSGGGDNDFLYGGAGGDFYSVGLGEGSDTIDDQGAGVDTLRLFLSAAATSVDVERTATALSYRCLDAGGAELLTVVATRTAAGLLVQGVNQAGTIVLNVTLAALSSGWWQVESLQFFAADEQHSLFSDNLSNFWFATQGSLAAAGPETPAPQAPGLGDATDAGGDGTDLLMGGGGDDTLLGRGDWDVLVGGGGDDVLSGGSGGIWTLLDPPYAPSGYSGDELRGGSGNDTLFDDDPNGLRDADLLLGGDGDDQLVLHGASLGGYQDYADGGAGEDFALIDLSDRSNAWTLTATPGGANLQGVGTGSIYVEHMETVAVLFGAGDDRASLAVETNYLDGGEGNDILAATGGDQALRGGVGDDFLQALARGAFFIDDGRLTSRGDALLSHAVDLNQAVVFSGLLTHKGGNAGLPNRYSTTFLFGGDSRDYTGLSLHIHRGDRNFSDSNVSLALNGVIIQTIASTFQFGEQIAFDLRLGLDGVLQGSITGGAQSFGFTFDAVIFDRSNGMLSIIQEPTDSFQSTFDNLRISSSTVVLDDFNRPDGLIGNGWIGDRGSVWIDGGVGNDVMQLDLSDETRDVSFSAAAASTAEGYTLVDGVHVRNVERIDYLLTGFGDDRISVGNMPYLDTGAGDDEARFSGWSGRQNYWNAGDGDDRLVVDLSDSVESIGAYGLYNEFRVAWNWQPASSIYLDQLYTNNVEAFTITTGSGADGLTGMSLDDVLRAGAGNDGLEGGGGDDILDGGSGDDRLFGGPGADWIDGGEGFDSLYLDLSDETRGLTFLATAAASASGYTLADGTHIRNVERIVQLTTGSGDDRASYSHWSGRNNTWVAGAGTDRLTVDLSTSTANITAASFYLDYRVRWDSSPGGDTNELYVIQVEAFSITTGTGADSLSGGVFDDILLAGAGNDQLDGLEGDDHLEGGMGDDLLSSTGGGDWIDGGDGYDSLVLDLSGEVRDIDFIAASVASATGQTLVNQTLLRNIERLGYLVTGSGDDRIFASTFGALETGDGDDQLIADSRAFANNGSWSAGAGQDRLTLDLSDVTHSVSLSLYSALNGELSTVVDGPLRYLYFNEVEAFTITGGSAADTLFGGAGDDVFDGGGGRDELYGHAGDDTLRGGEGDDYAVAGGGVDWIDGGAGVDLADLNFSTEVIDLTLSAAAAASATGATLANGAHLRNVEAFSLTTGAGNDGLTLDSVAFDDNLTAWDGREGLDRLTMDLSAVATTIHAGWSNNATANVYSGDLGYGPPSLVQLYNIEAMTITAGTGDDLLFGHQGDDVFNGGGGSDELRGGAADDQLDGGEGDDLLYGQAGDDVLHGGAGADYLVGGAGTDWIDGGEGDDWADVNLSDETQNLTLDVVIAGTADGDTLEDGTHLRNIESLSLTTGSGDDQLRVDDGAFISAVNVWNGGDGADRLTMELSATGTVIHVDWINQARADIYTGDVGYGPPRLIRLSNVETLAIVGGGAGDLMTGGQSSDLFDGRGGDDDLRGDLGDDQITGGAGDDRLYGNAGDDILNGGPGDDYLVGHDGIDTAVFAGPASSYVVTGVLGGTMTIIGAGVDTLIGIERLLFDGVAYGSPTEGPDTLFGGDAADSLGGLGGDDTLWGLGGDDNLTGGAGSDNLFGGAGLDLLDGGTGGDQMAGGAGDDRYVVDSALDAVSESASEGDDLVSASVSHTLAGEVERLTLLGTAAINGTGNELGNTLTGNGGINTLSGLDGDDRLFGLVGADVLLGGAGDDVLDGGLGADQMAGGLGNDQVLVDATSDKTTEAAGEGTDQVISSVSWTLGDNFENLTLTGANAARGYGNALNNIIVGNERTNDLRGYDGDDTLDGGEAADTLDGGAGDDILIGVGGIDRIFGQAGDDLLSGGLAADLLEGGDGNDRIDGGVGADQMKGGAGNDTFLVDAATDKPTELLGAGIDTVEASLAWTLGANIENLILIGNGAARGYGNGLNNNILGSARSSDLKGYDGDDILDGAEGADTLDGGAGADLLIGGVGNDKLTGGAGADLFLALQASVGLSTLSQAKDVDTISDLSFAQGDVVDLSGIDANTALAGDQAFVFVASFNNTAGQARLTYSAAANVSTLALDVDGDSKADYQISIAGNHLALTGDLSTGPGDGGWLL